MDEHPAVQRLRQQQRLIFRSVMAFMLDLVSRQIRRHDGDFTRAVLYMAACQASRPAAGQPVRTFSVRALAQSMDLPYETTRRKMAELEAAGLARRVAPRGYAVAPAQFEGAAWRADCEATWRALRRVIIDLKALDFDFDQFAGGPAMATVRDLAGIDRVVAVAILANDFQLRVLESGMAPHGDMLDAAIHCVCMLANAEGLSRDPRLAWTYAGAESPPPDSLRRPQTITDMARRLGLGHETVRRRVRLFVERGWMRRVTGGYLVTVERMQTAEVLQAGLMVSQRFLQLLDSLRVLGVDPVELAAEPATAA